MGFSEIIVIIVVAILVLGPEKLPDTIMQMAKLFKAVKRNIDDAKSKIEKEIRISELKDEAQKYKDEFSSTNENIRKKLSFEEFDDLKKDIIDKTKIDLSFDSQAKQNSNDTKQTQDMEKKNV